MTGFYQDMALTAQQMLTEFGQVVTLRRLGAGAYDTSTGRNTLPAPSDVPINGAVFDYPPGQVNGPGGLILAMDKRLLLSPGTIPTIEDRVIVNSIIYSIKGIQEINPAGIVVMYDMHIRS